MPLLRTHHAIAVLLVLAPVAAQAAPASKKPPPAPSSSQGPHHEAARRDPAKQAPKPAAKAAPGALKNTSHGSTAHVAAAAAPQRAEVCKSVGSPTEGHLVGGAHLALGPYLRVYPVYGNSDVRWGVEGLVGLIDRAAKSVRTKFNDAVCSVGHLSKAGGGELDRHASHESGRDADIGFYARNVAGKPILADHMVAFVGDGTAPSWPGAHFDDARNWALVAAMVGDGRAKVTHIFVAAPLRQRLLAYAEKIGAPPALRSRASEVLAQPHGALPHDDHFHVRIACPAGSDKCIEQPTAKLHRHGHAGALASHGHAVHPSHGAHAGSSPGGASAAGAAAAHGPSAHAAHAAPAHGGAAPPTAAPARGAAPPAKPTAKSESHEESARSEAPIPSLSPSVPGLDSAVIPSPLTGVRSTWGTSKDPAPPPASADPISDPDGVLDAH